MRRFLVKILVFSGILLLIGWLIYRALSSLDKMKADDKERAIRLENGTCVFDKMDLDKLLVKGNGRPFHVEMNIDTLLYYHKGELYNFVYDSNSSFGNQSFMLDNVKFSFDQNKNRGSLIEIPLDHSSPFQLVSDNNRLVVDPSEHLPWYIKKFPRSYECREEVNSNIATLRTELRIDNSVEGSDLKFMVIKFSVADEVVDVAFNYE